jgi:hypothetical protein
MNKGKKHIHNTGNQFIMKYLCSLINSSAKKNAEMQQQNENTTRTHVLPAYCFLFIAHLLRL